MTLTTRDDANALCIMVATIYAARLGHFFSRYPKADWLEYRNGAIEASITEAVLICEAVERDFPTR